jgi:hypothetical protein
MLPSDTSENSDSGNSEAVYCCDKHGIMNKMTDFVETVNQITKRK